jgi:N-acetylglucosaminyl-diphospho-decaprenol L-rhamnosyltransferase
MLAVDVVVVSYNSRAHLHECVAPLAGAPGVNVFVVDSASSDDCLQTISDLPVTTIPLTVNRGFGHGCNVGWRRGEAPLVLFLNPDGILEPDALTRLAGAFDDGPEVGLAAPRIIDADGSLDHSLRQFPRLRTTYAQALFLHRIFPHARWTDEVIRDPRVYEVPGTAEWVSGACMLVRRDVLERLGGFDDDFFLYSEDIDICRRIHDLGFDVRYEPSAVAVHEGGASAPRTELLPVLAASRIIYARKHRSPLFVLGERCGVAIGAVTHMAITRGGWRARHGQLRALARALSPDPRPGF